MTVALGVTFIAAALLAFGAVSVFIGALDRAPGVEQPPFMLCESLADSGTIMLRRERAWLGYLQPWAIVVDGKQVGRVSAGETIRLLLSTGRHSVAVRLGLAASKPLDVHVGSNDTLHLRCAPAMRGWNVLFLAPVYDLMFPTRTLVVSADG